MTYAYTTRHKYYLPVDRRRRFLVASVKLRAWPQLSGEPGWMPLNGLGSRSNYVGHIPSCDRDRSCLRTYDSEQDPAMVVGFS